MTFEYFSSDEKASVNIIDWRGLRHLIIVAGHAIYIGENFDDPSADGNRYLLPYQKGEPLLYIEHARAGVELAVSDPRALLIFSGGQTRAEAGPRSEALGYWLIAQHFDWWGYRNVANRAGVEDFSRDSFENLLFGICRFFECTQRYPAHVTVISWAFKEVRFHLHRKAIRFPKEQYAFHGPNNPPDLVGAKTGEAKTFALFREDPYGTREVSPGSSDEERASFLGEKRKARNPFHRFHGFAESNPRLASLLCHRGPEFLSGPLPWS